MKSWELVFITWKIIFKFLVIFWFFGLKSNGIKLMNMITKIYCLLGPNRCPEHTHTHTHTHTYSPDQWTHNMLPLTASLICIPGSVKSYWVSNVAHSRENEGAGPRHSPSTLGWVGKSLLKHPVPGPQVLVGTLSLKVCLRRFKQHSVFFFFKLIWRLWYI